MMLLPTVHDGIRQTRQCPQANWFKDEKGAFMVAGVFMMLVVVSLLYVLIGTAKVLIAREGMQDAADGGAFAAAVFMARGMNLIALINLLMALLLSILVAIRLVQTFFTIASVALYAVSWYFGLSAPAATACKQVADQMGNAYDQAKEVIMPALEVMHEVQEGTSVVVPFLAVGTGLLEAAQHHPPAQGAFALPAPQSLPVESDKFEVLCGRATEQATTGAFDAFASLLDVPDVLTAPALKPVEGLSRELGEATSDYLCGDGSGSPPEAKYKVEQSYPRFSGLEACEADAEGGECKRAEEEWQLATPQKGDENATCKAGADCDYDGLYETLARQARRDCEPKAHQSTEDYTWERVVIESTWTFDNRTWTETESEIVEDELMWQEDSPPCGRGGSLNRDEYQMDSGPRDQKLPTPLCVDKDADIPTRPGRPGNTQKVRYEAALRIFSCTIEEERSAPAGQPDQTFGGEGSEDKSPHKVQDDAVLGSETFQVRAIAFGPEVNAGSAMNGVKVILLNREEKNTDSAISALGFFNRFSIAQAEYYFDHNGSTDRGDWLWEMNWKARLKRVTLPTDEEKSKEQERQDENQGATSDKLARFGNKESPVNLEDACSKFISQCPSEAEVESIMALVKH